MRRIWPIALVVLALLAVQAAAGWQRVDVARVQTGAVGAPERSEPVPALLRWIGDAREAVRNRLRVRVELDGRSITITFGAGDDRRPARILLSRDGPAMLERLRPFGT